MNILICHEDQCYVECLAFKISVILKAEKINITGLTSTHVVKQVILKEKYDIALLGTTIQKRSGFELAQCLKKHCPLCAIIFMSDDSDLIYKAFTLKAFQFLPMFVENELLERELQRVVRYYKRIHAKCVLYTKQGVRAFYPRDILYIETRDHQLRMMTVYGIYEGYVNDLVKMKSELMYFHFCQIHQSYFVNMDYMMAMRRGEITLTNGEVIPTSILNRQCVKATIEKFLMMP